ncbi:MAG: copper amine oxidase [Solirubrobacteraceae bacterium]
MLCTAALGLVAAGCGSDDKTASTSTASPAAVTSEGSDSGASELRAGLTGQLEDHVYLASIAVAKGVGKGLDSAEFKAAAGTLDDNSVALSKSIESVYGAAAGKQFLALWRKHIGFFVDYTKAKATKDAAGATKAKAALDGYRADFGAFIGGANPNLPAEAVAAELKPHVNSLFAAIDAVVAGKTSTYKLVAAAAAHMPMTANILAGGIVKQFPDKFSGSVDAGAAALRAGLTAQLVDHVYLAALAVDTGVGAGLDSKAFTAAAGALDENSVALSKSIESVYGAAAGKQFLALWRKHIGFFVDYTKGLATKDQAAADKALADLDGYRADFGAFIGGANPNLPADAVAEELKPHVKSLADAIAADVKGSPETFDLIAAAAAHMPMTAKVLAGGIAKQFPDKFPAS